MDQWLPCAQDLRGKGSVTANGHGLFEGDGDVLKLIVMVAQFCEYTKNHEITLQKWVSCMVCKFYLNKAIK